MFKSTAMASQISNMSPIEYILDVIGAQQTLVLKQFATGWLGIARRMVMGAKEDNLFHNR